jgi:DNA-directed RNA polymerase sigma subunit (sigma70/sigma32)
MFKITIIDNGYAGRFNTEQECINWRNLKHPNKEYTIQNITATEKTQKLWVAANDYALSQIDLNERARLNAWLIDGSEAQKTMVRANIAFMDSIWTEYYNRKANLSDNLDFSSLGNKPFTFVEIAQNV